MIGCLMLPAWWETISRAFTGLSRAMLCYIFTEDFINGQMEAIR